jgi:hypothetical protein
VRRHIHDIPAEPKDCTMSVIGITIIVVSTNQVDEPKEIPFSDSFKL